MKLSISWTILAGSAPGGAVQSSFTLPSSITLSCAPFSATVNPGLSSVFAIAANSSVSDFPTSPSSSPPHPAIASATSAASVAALARKLVERL
jgi:hypothetical protein